jgi:hypothetical protein
MTLRELLPGESRRRQGVEDATRRALQGFVMPLWVGAGLADWWCHRRTDIEHTAGTAESVVHSAQMMEGGLPVLLGLFCEINAGALALTYASLVVHELTAIVDVAYADGRREVTPTEQHVHGFLERVPLMATAFLSVLHWDQARSLVGGSEDPDWRLKPKRRPVSRRYRATLLATVTGLVALPYAEELIRCLRADPPLPLGDQ